MGSGSVGLCEGLLQYIDCGVELVGMPHAVASILPYFISHTPPVFQGVFAVTVEIQHFSTSQTGLG